MKTEKLMKKYALSRKGASDFRKGIAVCTLSDLVMMFPVGLLYLFIIQMLPVSAGGTAGTEAVHGPLFFIIAGAALIIVMGIVTYFKYNAQFLAVYKESGVRRINLAEKLRMLPLSYFGKKDLSDLTSTLMEDCACLETTFSHQYPLYFSSMYSTVIIAASLFFFNVKLAFAAMWVIPLALIIVAVSKRAQNWSTRTTLASDLNVRSGIQEYLECVRDIKANNAERSYLSELDGKFRTMEKKHIFSEWFVSIFVVSSNMILKLGIATTALAGGIMLARGTVSLPVFIMFMIVVSRLYDPLAGALMNLAAINSASVHIERMREIDEQPEQTGTTEFYPADSTIQFNNVAFQYNDGTPVLNNVSFTAKQGEVTALIGPSGGGKSTVAKLAARFWDVQNGSIKLGGVNVKTVDPETLLKSYSIVFQDVTLFNNTIMENIRLGRRGAADEEVLAAARDAQCDEFVNRLPEKYNTVIGENGAALSGGERQRISIARAILKDAPVILLDEATASLDTENESKVQAALSRLIKNKTVLIIAHRMRTVAGADHLVLLRNGTVAEDGTPAQLRACGGGYARMVKLQTEE